MDLLIAIVVTLVVSVALFWWLASLDRDAYVGRHRPQQDDGE